MKQVHPNYTFVASTKTITLTGLNIAQDQLLLITNATRGVIYYNFASSSHRAVVTAGANTTVVLTDASTTGHADSDQLVIHFDDQLSTQTIAGTVTANVPGAATSANQTTANTSLSSIDSKLPALSSGRVPVDIQSATLSIDAAGIEIKNDTGNPVPVSGTVTANAGTGTFAVSAASLPLPSGAATSANQATGNTSLSNIDSDLGAPSDAAATTDTGSFSLISLFKRLLSTKLPDSSDGRIPTTGTISAHPEVLVDWPFANRSAISGLSFDGNGKTFVSPAPYRLGTISCYSSATFPFGIPVFINSPNNSLHELNVTSISGNWTLKRAIDPDFTVNVFNVGVYPRNSTTGQISSQPSVAITSPGKYAFQVTQSYYYQLIYNSGCPGGCPAVATITYYPSFPEIINLPQSGGRISVDGSGVTQPVSGPLTDTQLRATAVPVSAASLPLPSGAATSANQTTANTSLSNIDTDIGALADSAATTDTGSFSLISLFKRLLSTKLPNQDGGRIPVTFSGSSNNTRIQNYSSGDLLFITAQNAAKVDGSAVTQPVSGTVTADLSSVRSLGQSGNSGGLLVYGSTNTGQCYPLPLKTDGSLQVAGDYIIGGGYTDLFSLIDDGGFNVNVNGGTVTAASDKGSVSEASTQSITTGGTHQQVFDVNANRKYLLIQNISDTDMYLGIGFNPSNTTPAGLLLAKSGGGIVFESSYIPTSEVRIVCATAGKRFVALQG